MNVFGIGPLELLVVLAVAVIFLGPEKLPELARALGKAVYQFQQMIEPYREEISRAMEPVNQIQHDLNQTLRGAATSTVIPPVTAAASASPADQSVNVTGEADVDDAAAAAANTIAPPALMTDVEAPSDPG